MKLPTIFFVLAVLKIQLVQGQIKRQFPNLFRGGRRPDSEDGKEPLLAIQPMPGRGEARRAQSNVTRNTFEEGFIQLDRHVWSQEEIEIQLFSSGASRFRFRQSPSDQPKPNLFYGTMGSDGDDIVDSISLVQTTVTQSQISVVTGSVHVNGNLYQIRQLPGGELVVSQRGLDTDFDNEIEIEDEAVEAWVAPDEPNNNESLEVDFPLHERRLGDLPRNGTDASSSLELLFGDGVDPHRLLQSRDDGSQLDIMIVYTRNAMCAAARYPNQKCEASTRNKATIEGIIELAVKETNEAFAASGIRSKLRLVKLHYEDKYDDTAHSWSDVFSHFTGNRDGQMDYIHAMRDQYGADFVSIIVNTRGFCGSAHRPRVPHAERAFSMVRWDCATGHYTFTHELAHTLGCRHDQKSTKSDIEPGDFNFGFQHTQGNRFRTLMAYNCPNGGCQRILRFSNPSMNRQGVPFGNALADNARFIRERLDIYANFRPSVVLALPQPVQAAPPANNPVIGGVYSRKTKRLDTVNHPGSLLGAAGNMFEVVAKTDLQVTGFSVMAFAATTAVVEVYKLNQPGSFVGEEYNPDAWTLIGSATIATLDNEPTALPSGTISNVVMAEGTTQSFYVTFQADTNYNRYSRASRYGEISAQNDDIQFKVGYTASYPFAFHPKAPRIFNGEILYEPMPASTLSVTGPTAGTDKTGATKMFQTTFASNNGYAGNMFTIQSKTDIVIDTFDLNAGSMDVLGVQIFTKYGDFDRNDNPTEWIEICSTQVEGKGESKPTSVPTEAVKSIAIKAHERQSFYITFDSPSMRYTSALLDPNYLGNDDVALVASAGTQYPYKSYFANRIWNGNIYYMGNSGGSADIQGRDTKVESVAKEEAANYAYGAVARSSRNPP